MTDKKKSRKKQEEILSFEEEFDESEEEEYIAMKELLEEDNIIIAKNLYKDYEIGNYIVRAVEDVSLSIKSGDFIVIKGPSGAGKTTLLNLLGGLDSPNKGVIFSHGVKITAMEEESLATFRLLNSGFIFQNYNLISTLTAAENVIFPMSIAGMDFKECRSRSIKLLEKIGLEERKEHLPFQLSAGEQQRVAIARALANDPPVLFADEPTANLDKNTSEFIRDLFNDLKSQGKTIIIATHDDYLIDLANRIITFEDAKIIDEKLINK